VINASSHPIRRTGGSGGNSRSRVGEVVLGLEIFTDAPGDYSNFDRTAK